MHTAPITCATLALTATLAAQTVTLPGEAASWPGTRHQATVFGVGLPGADEARTQLIYPLGSLPSALPSIQRLGFRALGTLDNAAASVDLTVTIATSPVDPDAPSQTFAQNLSGNAVQVFSGTLSLPSAQRGTWPRPWDVDVPLQTAFPLAPAPGDRSLVVDVHCTNNTGPRPWYVEQYHVVETAPGRGTPILTQTDCLLPHGRPQMQASHVGQGIHPGGALRLTLGDYPRNQPNAAANALFFGLRAGGGSLGGATLPVNLQSLGLEAPDNCRWTVEPIVWFPMTYETYSWGAQLNLGRGLTIPDDPALAHQQLFLQNASLIRYPTGLKVFPSVALQFTLGASVTPSGSVVSSSGVPQATTGAIDPAGPVSLRLQ